MNTGWSITGSCHFVKDIHQCNGKSKDMDSARIQSQVQIEACKLSHNDLHWRESPAPPTSFGFTFSTEGAAQLG